MKSDWKGVRVWVSQRAHSHPKIYTVPPARLILTTRKASCKMIWPTTINSEYSSTRQSVPLFPLVLSGCLPKLEEKIIINDYCKLKEYMKGELINMTRGWDKKKSDSPTGIEPMTSRTPGGHSIHWAARTHGEQGHLTEFICDRLPAYR